MRRCDWTIVTLQDGKDYVPVTMVEGGHGSSCKHPIGGTDRQLLYDNAPPLRLDSAPSWPCVSEAKVTAPVVQSILIQGGHIRGIIASSLLKEGF